MRSPMRSALLVLVAASRSAALSIRMAAAAPPSRVQVAADTAAVSAAVLARVDAAAEAAIKARGKFALGIPGGSVMKMLSGSAPAWAEKTTLAYVNHKAVAMDDIDLATHAKASKLFLDNWAGCTTIVMGGSADATAEASAYDAALKALPEDVLPRGDDGLPMFDMLLIGLGDDGHVGSLYPGRSEIDYAGDSWVVPVDKGKGPASISLSLPVMSAAREVVVAACGVSEKSPAGKSAAMLKAIESADESPASFPACGLRGCATWVIDEMAASKLSAAYAK